MYNHQELIADMKQAVRDASMLISEMRDTHVEEKSDHTFVTAVDIAIQKRLVAGLAAKYPDIEYLGEEEEGEVQKEGYQWCIDPIDGTNDFIKGIPLYCISLALLHDGKPILGVVYNPPQDEMFSSDNPVVLDKQDVVRMVTVAAGGSSWETELSLVNAVASHDNNLKIRRFGSCALEMAYLSVGRFDGIIVLGNKTWDYAAGMALLGDPQMIITEYQPEVFVIGRPEVHDQLLSIVKNTL